MKKIDKIIDSLVAQIIYHIRFNRGVFVIFALLFFISFGLSKLPYFNLFFSSQIVLMIGMLLFFMLLPKKILYIFFVALLLLFLFYTITGGTINDTFQNAFFILILVVTIMPNFYNEEKRKRGQDYS